MGTRLIHIKLGPSCTPLIDSADPSDPSAAATYTHKSPQPPLTDAGASNRRKITLAIVL